MSNMEVIDGLLMKNNGILTTRECKKMNKIGRASCRERV